MKTSFLLSLIKSEPVAVVGYGISNAPLVDFLLSRGARITVYDKKTREAFGITADALEKRGVRLVLGENYLNVSETLVFRTPGIRADAINAPDGAYITSEMELFLELTPAKIYAVTGSDGKTTTTTLTHLFLDAHKRRHKGAAYVGGNIGAPLLPLADSMTEEDAAILELSSFQLMGMRYSPDAAAITNITPNHLNWHRDMEEYTEAKLAICGDRTKKIVLNADNEATASFCPENALRIYFSSTKARGEFTQRDAHLVYINEGKIIYFDGERETQILDVSDIKLPGRHNIENYMAAIALTYGDVDTNIYREIARTFGGVKHRLELVATVDGVKYYNSSIDSTPTRTAAALSALNEKPIVICGGADKNTDYAPLATLLCARAKAVILNGETAKKIGAALDACPDFDKNKLIVYFEADLRSATNKAREIAELGDTVLLSPASTSFDQFKNFEERGEAFRVQVLEFDTI